MNSSSSLEAAQEEFDQEPNKKRKLMQLCLDSSARSGQADAVNQVLLAVPCQACRSGCPTDRETYSKVNVSLHCVHAIFEHEHPLLSCCHHSGQARRVWVLSAVLHGQQQKHRGNVRLKYGCSVNSCLLVMFRNIEVSFENCPAPTTQKDGY